MDERLMDENEYILFDRIETIAKFFENNGTQKKYFLVKLDSDENDLECLVVRSVIGKMMKEKRMYGLDIKSIRMTENQLLKFKKECSDGAVAVYGKTDEDGDCITNCGGTARTFNPLAACHKEWAEWYMNKYL